MSIVQGMEKSCHMAELRGFRGVRECIFPIDLLEPSELAFYFSGQLAVISGRKTYLHK